MFIHLQEINTLDDMKVEFSDDKNQLIWFLQPQEAQFYLAAESLRHKPSAPLTRSKLPFRPPSSRKSHLQRRWTELQEIQGYKTGGTLFKVVIKTSGRGWAQGQWFPCTASFASFASFYLYRYLASFTLQTFYTKKVSFKAK